MAFSGCDNISQLLKPSFPGQPWSKLMPSWSPLCFSLGIGVFQASQYDSTKIPTSQKRKPLKARFWDLPITQGWWYVSVSAAPYDSSCLTFSCKCVLCATLKNQILWLHCRGRSFFSPQWATFRGLGKLFLSPFLCKINEPCNSFQLNSFSSAKVSLCF